MAMAYAAAEETLPAVNGGSTGVARAIAVGEVCFEVSSSACWTSKPLLAQWRAGLEQKFLSWLYQRNGGFGKKRVYAANSEQVMRLSARNIQSRFMRCPLSMRGT